MPKPCVFLSHCLFAQGVHTKKPDLMAALDSMGLFADEESEPVVVVVPGMDPVSKMVEAREKLVTMKSASFVESFRFLEEAIALLSA